MPKVITNTSPLLYLYRIKTIEWLPSLFQEIWTPTAVADELKKGNKKGYDVPGLEALDWLQIVEPATTPSEWLASDLGAGEIATMALALENPDFIVLLDDILARRTAQAAGLEVWGTLRVIFEAKNQGMTAAVGPIVDQLEEAGMWISAEIRQRILVLAGENDK
ncbi:MAG: DUF3368 domain-containing protein [Proteobacteria bacterium]|nr:DUF3368 domain-containing protein [Pseudomonadota bacterium]